MRPTDEARMEFDEAFLREVARLLPEVDVVRLRSGESSRQQKTEAVAGHLLTRTAQQAAGHLVGSWSAVFDEQERPDSLRFEWSSLGSTDVVRATVTARFVAGALQRPDDKRSGVDVPDLDLAAARLQRLGWSTAIRSRSSTGFNVLGRLDGFRLDVIVQVDAGLLTTRVSGPAVVVGQLARQLVEAGFRDVPWPLER